MNGTILRALLTDAFYQVVDNKVFRLLLFMTLLPILFTFIVGFTDEGISILFGVKTLNWSELASIFGTQEPKDTKGVSEAIIQYVQSLWIEGLVGNYGLLFCVAATAFFIPRMLEKGTADTVFSKPVSRLVLLFARYMSGVLFVLILSTVMIVGMHLGFLIASGYSDLGFLWGALTLTYIFSLVHGVSTVVATFTRSSITAILCSLIFSLATTSVHCVWVGIEQTVEQQELIKKTSDEDEESSDKASKLGRRIRMGVDVTRTILPKLSDADYITAKLRRTLEGDPFILEDEEGGLTIEKSPYAETAFEAELVREFEDAEDRFVVTWDVQDDGRTDLGRVQIDRLNRGFEFTEDGSSLGEKRSRRLTAKRASDQALVDLGALDDIFIEPIKLRQRVGRQNANFVRWVTGTEDSQTRHERVYLTFDNYLYQIDFVQYPTGYSTEDWDFAAQEFLEGLSFASVAAAMQEQDPFGPNPWYESKFDWDAPWRFNIFFSIGSSLAFLALMLLISWIRLSRVDF